MNANLIFNWLKDPRFTQDNEMMFMPVEVAATDMPPAPAPSSSFNHSAQHPDGRIEIELVNGHRRTFEGSWTPAITYR